MVGPLSDVAAIGLAPFRCEPDIHDDLIGHTIIKCWELVTIPDRPFGYVHRMARNLYLDLSKCGHHTREVAGEIGAGHIAVYDPEIPDALDHLVADVDRDRVQDAIRALPEVTRWCVVLHHLYERSCAEIAVQLGINEGTVKMRLYRGRRMLHTLLTASLVDDPPQVGLFSGCARTVQAASERLGVSA